MERVVEDEDYYGLLKRRVAALRPAAAPENETRTLLAAVARVMRKSRAV
jgi:hypothetical protein